MTLNVFVFPLSTGKLSGVYQIIGDLMGDVKPFDNCILAICFMVFKYPFVIGLYTRLFCVIYGTGTF